jgi:hypothetical protein
MRERSPRAQAPARPCSHMACTARCRESPRCSRRRQWCGSENTSANSPSANDANVLVRPLHPQQFLRRPRLDEGGAGAGLGPRERGKSAHEALPATTTTPTSHHQPLEALREGQLVHCSSKQTRRCPSSWTSLLLGLDARRAADSSSSAPSTATEPTTATPRGSHSCG